MRKAYGSVLALAAIGLLAAACGAAGADGSEEPEATEPTAEGALPPGTGAGAGGGGLGGTGAGDAPPPPGADATTPSWDGGALPSDGASPRDGAPTPDATPPRDATADTRPPTPDATPPADAAPRPDASPPPDAAPPTGGPGPRPTRTCSYSADADGFFRLVTQSGGVDYWVRLPVGYNANTPYPMVVGTHGCGDSAKNFATWAMVPYAMRGGQSYVAVSVGGGRDGQCWSAATDESKVMAVVADVRTCFYVHQKKVTLAGYSSGGILAYYTALRNARTFAGLLISNSSLQSAFGAGTDAALAGAGWRLNVAISARTGDDQFAIAQVRTDRSKLQGAGFPVQYREQPGGHSGTSDDWSGFLLPKITGFTAP